MGAILKNVKKQRLKNMDTKIIIIGGIGIIALFLVCREIATWYWKINKIIRSLDRIERNTRKEGVTYPDDDDSLF